MLRPIPTGAALCLAAMLALVGLREAHGREQGSDPLAPLAWMAGCWEMRLGPRLVEEQWMAPRGGLMLGVSRTVRNDTLVEYEQVRIESRGASIHYVASPSRQATTEFLASSVAADSIVFENPQHDFPKKIVYGRRADSLIATIEGPRGGTTRRISFPYSRVACRQGG